MSRPPFAQQNEQLKTRYSVSKTPTVVVLDPWAQPLADRLRRAGRRKEETPGQPKACIEYLDNVLKNRPPDVAIARGRIS